MPNLKSAKKRLKQAEKAHDRNRSELSRIRTLRRRFWETASQDDPAQRDAAFTAYCSALDKGVKHGVIKRNTAIRRKTRASNRIHHTAAPAAQA